MSYFIYILLCDQKSYYIGLTHNLEQRLSSHKSKANMATKEFSDLQMIYHEQFGTRKEAEIREKQLKGWSIAKKEALINGDLELLKQLSKS
jgi:predicted GIY-YIG superfamily endonuclease